MRLRHLVQTCLVTGAIGLAAPAFAGPAPYNPDDLPAPPPMAMPSMPAMPAAPVATPAPAPMPAPAPRGYDMPASPQPAYQPGTYADPRAKENWLRECRRRLSARDPGMGGALIGGVAGGFIGNRLAGKRHRTVGTIAGAAVGAATGYAIDKAEDAGRNRDWCEAYLDDYYARYSQPGYGYQQGHAQMQPVQGYVYYAMPVTMMVPVAQPQAKRHCTEEVVTEYVEEPVPVHHTKRVRVVPQKRVRVTDSKRVPLD